jgi:hypothetical protein
MATLQAIWSNGMLFATVGSAVVSLLLMAVCFIAGLCPCEKAEEMAADATPAPRPADFVDYGWLMRAA